MPPIRARDVRTEIAERGFERAVAYILERMLEEFAGHRQQMRELTELVSQCIDQVEKMVHVGGVVQARRDELKRIHQDGENNGDGS